MNRQNLARGEAPKFNALVNLLASDSSFGYLCLDAVSADDLGWYIHKKALDTILSLAHSLRRTETDFVDMVEAYALEHKLRPLRAVLKGKNRLALYVEVPAAERNDDIMEWRWVRRLLVHARAGASACSAASPIREAPR